MGKRRIFRQGLQKAAEGSKEAGKRVYASGKAGREAARKGREAARKHITPEPNIPEGPGRESRYGGAGMHPSTDDELRRTPRGRETLRNRKRNIPDDELRQKRLSRDTMRRLRRRAQQRRRRGQKVEHIEGTEGLSAAEQRYIYGY